MYLFRTSDEASMTIIDAQGEQTAWLALVDIIKEASGLPATVDEIKRYWTINLVPIGVAIVVVENSPSFSKHAVRLDRGNGRLSKVSVPE